MFNEENVPKYILFLYLEPCAKYSLIRACSSKKKQTVADNVCNDNQLGVLGPYLRWCVNNGCFSATYVANDVALNDLVYYEVAEANNRCKRTNTGIKDA